MGGSHQHGAGHSNGRRIGLTLVLVTLYMVAEVIGGFWSGSLALLADAGHMLADAGALLVALIAMHIAQRPASSTHTYGYWRAEILAALANGAALIAIAGTIGYHAVTRLGQPPEVHGPVMLVVACGGLVVNLIGLWILHDGKSHNLNVRGAWFHVLSDALGSLGAIASGLLVTLYGFSWADPVASLVIAVLVLYSGWSLLAQTASVLMEAVPAGIELTTVEQTLRSVDDVLDVHDLHVWSVTSGRAVMSAHLNVTPAADRRRVMAEVHRLMRDRFDLHHSTFQIDCPEQCPLPGLPCD